MNIAECDKLWKVLSQKYCYWYWQYLSKAVLVLALVYAILYCHKVLLLALTVVFMSIDINVLGVCYTVKVFTLMVTVNSVYCCCWDGAVLCPGVTQRCSRSDGPMSCLWWSTPGHIRRFVLRHLHYRKLHLRSQPRIRTRRGYFSIVLYYRSFILPVMVYLATLIALQ